MEQAPTPHTTKPRPRPPAEPMRRIILRICWPADMAAPAPGLWLESEKGRVVYRVLEVEVLHHGVNNPKPRFKLRAAVYKAKDVPEGTEIASWSLTIFRKPKALPQELPALHHHNPAPRVLAAPAKPPQAARDPKEMPAYRAVSDGAGAAQPAAWTDPADMGKYGRHAQLVKGYRSKCVLRFMRNTRGSSITEQHIVAADLFRLNYDIGRLGRSSGKDFLQEGGPAYKGPVSGPPALAEEQTAAAREFKRTLAFLRPLRPDLLIAVLLGNKSIAAWCREQEKLTGRRPNHQAEMGRLITMLDALADYHAADVVLQLTANGGYPIE